MDYFIVADKVDLRKKDGRPTMMAIISKDFFLKEFILINSIQLHNLTIIQRENVKFKLKKKLINESIEDKRKPLSILQLIRNNSFTRRTFL